jgi:hypothetical protein
MWLALGAVLIVVWALSFLVFKVAGWAIHLLIIGAVVAAVVHIVSRMRSST